MGFGHIARCIALYQAFEEKCVRPHLIVNADKITGKLLAGKRHRRLNWVKRKNEVFRAIKGADICIVDSYLADKMFYANIARLARIPVYIDDNIRHSYPPGVVVNGSIHAEEMRYPNRAGATYLLGSKYAPIRKEFWSIPAKESKENIESIMVTFGGNDDRNMTPKILQMLTDHYPKLVKNIVIGKGFKNTKLVQNIKDERTNLMYYPDADGMKKAMLKSDMAISAGGQTLYELARVGVPTIAVLTAYNQLNNARGWFRAGFIGSVIEPSEKTMIRSLLSGIEKLKDVKLRIKRSAIGKRFVDGCGSRRIAGALLKMAA